MRLLLVCVLLAAPSVLAQSRYAENPKPSKAKLHVSVKYNALSRTQAIVKLSATPAQPNATDNIILQAAVSSPVKSQAAPTGSVSFFVGSQPLGTAHLVNGVASVTVNLPAGEQDISAVYSGDKSYR